MSQLVRNTLGMMTGMAVLGAVFFVGSQSFAPFPATGSTAATATAAAPVGTLPANGFTDVAKAVTPAVVNITTVIGEKISGRAGENELRDRMEEFFGGPNGPFGPKFRGPQGPQGPMDPRSPRGFHGGGQGSGVIVSPDGYVLTNNHVIDGAREVTVTLPDKREFQGKIVGTDPKTDLAVVKIDAKNLPAVPWGDASKLQVGEYVLAVGNPFGLNSTVTLGIVSALGRGRMGITQYEDFIQTDAAINPGNSGGALVNTKGELVGINTAIFGVTNVKGALVTDVKEDSPADHAGLQQGDVILSYQASPVEDAVALQRLVTKTIVGTKVPMKILRDGREKDLNVTIAEQPGDPKIAKAKGDEKEYAFAGVAVQNLDSDTAKELGLKGKTQGVVVTSVEPESGADKAGLMPGDVIREINRQPVKSVKEFEQVSSAVKKGENVLILINRRGASLFLSAKV